jgi:hypothetical protein
MAYSSRGFWAFACLASVSLRRRLFLPDASMLVEATEGTGVDSVWSVRNRCSKADEVDETRLVTAAPRSVAK